jgi:hypothetical protein
VTLTPWHQLRPVSHPRMRNTRLSLCPHDQTHRPDPKGATCELTWGRTVCTQVRMLTASRTGCESLGVTGGGDEGGGDGLGTGTLLCLRTVPWCRGPWNGTDVSCAASACSCRSQTCPRIPDLLNTRVPSHHCGRHSGGFQ